MNLTSKSRYALKIMIDLAHFGATQPLVRRADIAQRQGIPTDYLDQIMIRLRAGNLVQSIRGRTGGYRLARRPDSITMWDLFSSVEENIIPVECISTGEPCGFEASCSSKEAWGTIFGAIKSSLSTVTLDSLTQKWVAELSDKSISNHMLLGGAPIRECKTGGKCDSSHLAACHASVSNSGGADLNG